MRLNNPAHLRSNQLGRSRAICMRSAQIVPARCGANTLHFRPLNQRQRVRAHAGDESAPVDSAPGREVSRAGRRRRPFARWTQTALTLIYAADLFVAKKLGALALSSFSKLQAKSINSLCARAHTRLRISPVRILSRAAGNERLVTFKLQPGGQDLDLSSGRAPGLRDLPAPSSL